ncbi:adenylate/guanylate cyclase domain-containing protein [Winogradskyella alexanderae]|uniref:Tetratricopeptide repeat protein n=1 Tax=Winogradskyella alexanderae TaxID=2877123 RepID=A0ABS7XUQ7_9FLAO|nr:adenylate/guanylate cyclase domain-containing protein [Winogradskyella alexanderae]MCA0132756.1 tetratricopeptide repeat protein [Winogradskyella alexanderae]
MFHHLKKAYFVTIGFFFIVVQFAFGQDQKVADSLSVIYKKNNLDGIEKLELLRDLSFNELNDPELSLKYANELIALSELERNYQYIHSGYLQKGYYYFNNGDIELALEAFFKSNEASNKVNYIEGQGVTYAAIADSYVVNENFDTAIEYYNQAIAFIEKTNDSINLASILINFGDAHFNNKKYDAALEKFKKSIQICQEINFLTGTAYNKGNIGMVYAEQGKDQLAESNINEAIEILELQEDYYPISIYLTYMSDIYARKKDFNTALTYLERSLNLAKKYGLKDQISEANLKLSEFHESKGDLATAYPFFKEHIVYRDLVVNLQSVQKAADVRTEFEVSKEKAIAKEKQKTQRIIIWSTVGVLFLIGLLAFGLYRRNKYVRATNKIIANEKERSDKLLLNILPEETAQELKDKGRVEAKKYPSVTVLFSDFKGFTKYAEGLSPEELVKTIDYYFTEFDLIMERHGLEKIKTIGDAYMAVGGLSFDNVDKAKEMILAAQEMNNFVVKAKDDVHTSATFDIRIGINTGPVVAGVVGKNKFAYDIWGDTVNIASRMESTSEPGRINISEYTYERIKSDFECTYRGELEVKNRGHLKMYFVN